MRLRCKLSRLLLATTKDPFQQSLKPTRTPRTTRRRLSLRADLNTIPHSSDLTTRPWSLALIPVSSCLPISNEASAQLSAFLREGCDSYILYPYGTVVFFVLNRAVKVLGKANGDATVESEDTEEESGLVFRAILLQGSK